MRALAKLATVVIAGLMLAASNGGAARAAGDEIGMGKPDAPVKMVEYASASCPHCAQFNNEVFPAFKKKYIDTGVVYYELREILTAPVNFAAAANTQDAVTRQRIPIFVCPSEVNDRMKPATSTTAPGAINRYPCTYGANVGTWKTWDPNTGQGGDGALPYTAVPNGGKFVVFMQKDQSAYACEMQSLTSSRCGTLN